MRNRRSTLRESRLQAAICDEVVPFSFPKVAAETAVCSQCADLGDPPGNESNNNSWELQEENRQNNGCEMKKENPPMPLHHAKLLSAKIMMSFWTFSSLRSHEMSFS